MQRLRFFAELLRNDSVHQMSKLDTNPITNSKMADNMAAVQGKVTAFVELTKEKYMARAIR